jgi:hypothetical protein
MFLMRAAPKLQGQVGGGLPWKSRVFWALWNCDGTSFKIFISWDCTFTAFSSRKQEGRTCCSNAYLIRAASETIRSMTTSQVLIGSPISWKKMKFQLVRIAGFCSCGFEYFDCINSNQNMLKFTHWTLFKVPANRYIWTHEKDPCWNKLWLNLLILFFSDNRYQ